MKAKLHIPGRLQTPSTHSTTHMHVHCLLMLLNAFPSAQEFVLVRGFATPPSSPARPLPPASQLAARQEREIEEGRKEHHVSQSQRCIGDIGTWQPAISHKCLPARPLPSASTISSPTSSIDFRLTGVVIASGVFAWPASCDTSVCYDCHVCWAISVLVVSGQLLHLLLMELLTGNKLK